MEPVFRILGPLEVSLDERLVSLGGRRERAVLAILLLNAGEVVSVERLIDGLWGEARPSSAKHMIHEYVYRLRQALLEVAPIETRPPGYLLEPVDGAVDFDGFAQVTKAARLAARAERHDDALRSYDRALALWRGDALTDVGLEGEARTAAARLDQERRLISEERIDCALALGQHLQLIPELEHRVEQAPLSERPRAHLMLALYRAGRQIEALERYREGRALLVEQAGVEPGPELRKLERAILEQDPALELAPPARDGERAVSVAQPPARRRGTRAAVAVVLLAAAVAALVFVVHGSGSAKALARIDANSAGAIDPGRNRLVDEVHVGTGPGRIAAGFGSLWVVNDSDSTVSRVDPDTGTVQDTITVGGDPTGIVVGAGFVWVTCTGTRSVDRIDPRLNRRTQRTTVGNGPSGIAISPGAVWVTNRLDDTVTKIDSKTGKFLRTLDAGANPSDIAYGLGSLWITDESTSAVVRLDPRNGELRQFPVGNGPEAVAIGYGSVWVANSLDGTLSRIDSRTDVVTTFPIGLGPSSVLVSNGSVWVADSYGGRIVRFDPTTNHTVRTIQVGSGPQSLVSTGDRVWLSARETAGTHRGGTLRLFDLNAPDSLDEGVGYVGGSWPVFAMSSDGLVGFRRVGGLDGGTLIPDLATSLPSSSDGGRTYTFQLQRGVRYSNGDPVRASDFRRALERDIRLHVPGDTVNGDLVGDEVVGAGGCSRSRCDLSRGVVTNDRAGTVSLHLRKPDTDLLYKLAMPFAYPIPAGVPLTRTARLGVPGTGPYMIRSYADRRLLLVRNPRFREWSAAAQPDGYPDRIVLTFGKALDDQLAAVEQGKDDLMSQPPASRLEEISTRYAAQVHVFPATTTFAIFLNTTLPPFDNLDARKAVNFAIDRRKAVAGAFGGALAAAVTCQIVPAGMAGYRPYCPYTRHPTAAGVWSGPDLARARRLVVASGTRGQTVVFRTGPFPPELAIGHLAVATLNRLGYRASLRVNPDNDRYFDTISDSRTRAQAGFFAWAPDYPSPSNSLTLFTCGAFRPAHIRNPNVSEFCNPGLDKAIARALTRQTTDTPAVSNTTWAAVDRQVTDLAPWVPLMNTREIVVVSRRVGNIQSNPQWGVLYDQMWVR